MGVSDLEGKRDVLRLYLITLPLELVRENLLFIFPVLTYSVAGKMPQVTSMYVASMQVFIAYALNISITLK